nr:MAG: hypothetical protein [Tombusviridae sp.]
MDTANIDQYVVLTKWGIKWLKFAWNYAVEGGPAEKFAKIALAELDKSSAEPADYIDGLVYENKKSIFHGRDGTPISVGVVERKKCVVRKGNRSKFAASIAKLAYNKFGNRVMSEANILVTRKWIQKYLEEPFYKDLRTCDKNIAIDRALFLSFVPTTDFQKMTLVTTTNRWVDRLNADNVFGRVFRFATSAHKASGAIV